MKLKLTKAVVEAIEPPAAGVLFVRDSELPGFALRVTAKGAKSYVVERKMGGKTVRATVGRVGVVTLPDARVQGMQWLAGMAAGKNPHDARREAAAPPLAVATMSELFEAYLLERSRTDPPLKPRTVGDYRKLWKYLGDWNGRPIGSIDATLPLWWTLVDDVTPERWPDRCEVVRDYWRFMLFTGMRSIEAARLEVEQVDLRRGVFAVEDTKNRETFEVPVGPWVRAMLERRIASAKKIGSPWVFPAPKREAGHTSPAHDIRDILVAKHGLPWSPHDLRRTFATWLDSLEVSAFVVKRLLNHKSGANGDVTAGYVQSDIERLRPVMDRLEAKLLAMCCPE